MRRMQAVIYCRVSTKEQTKNLSLPTQLAACREYCQRQGLEVGREFMEQGESAKTADRTELQRLLAFCRENKGRVHTLVIYNVSRLARDRYDHVSIRHLLARLGITVRSVTEPIDESSSGKLMEGILSSFAEFDNAVKAERTVAGMRAGLERGRWTFKAPLGFLNAKGTASLKWDSPRAEILRDAFIQVADGTPVAEVLRQINATRGAAGRPLALQSFRAILRNQIYAGRIVLPRWGIDCRGDFEPLVGESVFRRVQLRLNGRGVEPKPHVKDRDDFPLRRFLKCAKCARPISGSWSKGRKDRYGYYHCPKCRGVRGRREAIEKRFLEHLESLKPEPGYLRLFRAVVLDVWRAEQERAREIQRLKAERVAELQQRADRLEEAFIYEKTIDHAVYVKQKDRIQEQLTIAELELHDARIDALDVEGVLAFAEHLIANVGRIWLEATLDHRQRIQAAIFPEGIPFDGSAFGTATTCLAFNTFAVSKVGGNRLASPPGFEPGFQP
jgi:site-specific DNA recombinase